MFNCKENDEIFVIPLSNDIFENGDTPAKSAAQSEKSQEIINRFFPTKTKVKQYSLTPSETKAFLNRWQTYLEKGDYQWSTYREGKTGRNIVRCKIPVAEVLYFMTELQIKGLYDQTWEWVEEGAVETAFCMYEN